MIAGDKAPNFTLYDHTGRPRTLSALLSKGPVVLFFFPIASSPICTAQACHFRDLSNEFATVGAQRVGISTDTVDRQAHFAQQRSFDYPLLSDADGVVSELFGVRRGRLAKLRKSVVARQASRHSRHTRRRGLLPRLFPVKRTTFVIDTDRTVIKVVSNEVRASVHADQALWFLENREVPDSPPHVRHTHALQQSEVRAETVTAEPAKAEPVKAEPAGDWLEEPETSTEPETVDEPDVVVPYALTDRIDSGIELALETPVVAVDNPAKPPRWPKNDVRTQILAWCAHSSTIAELAARLSLPLGSTRYLVDDLVTQGYLRVCAPLGDAMSVDERRDLMTRTLVGLRAL
jgi:peroxiredoxin Q/BCP